MNDTDLERQSFINLVNYYQDELRRLNSGENINTLFTKSSQKPLYKYGVLVHKATVSPESKEVLGLE